MVQGERFLESSSFPRNDFGTIGGFRARDVDEESNTMKDMIPFPGQVIEEKEDDAMTVQETLAKKKQDHEN